MRARGARSLRTSIEVCVRRSSACAWRLYRAALHTTPKLCMDCMVRAAISLRTRMPVISPDLALTYVNPLMQDDQTLHVRSTMITLGLDPGATNFGWCLLTDGVPTKCGMVEFPVKNVTDAHAEVNVFLAEMKPLVMASKDVVAERFQTRSVGGRSAIMGPLGERVNIMLGALVSKREVALIPAMTWKGAVKKRLSLDLLYKAVAVPPHVVDAAMIGWWWYRKSLYGKKPMQTLTLGQVAAFASALEATYPGKLRNVKDKAGRIRDFKQDFLAK